MIFAFDIYEWILNFMFLGISLTFWGLFIVVCFVIYFAFLMSLQLTFDIIKKWRNK